MGSNPTFTVRGLPRASLARRDSAVTTSTQPLVRRSKDSRCSCAFEHKAPALDAVAPLEQDAGRPAGRAGAPPPGCGRTGSPRCRPPGRAPPPAGPRDRCRALRPRGARSPRSPWPRSRGPAAGPRAPERPGAATGWTFRTRPGNAPRKAGERRRMNPARHTRSTWCSRSRPATSRSKSSRARPRWSRKRAGTPACRARSRARASSTFETTTAIRPPERGVAGRRRAGPAGCCPGRRRGRRCWSRARYSKVTPSPATTDPMTKLVSPRRSRECSTSWRSRRPDHDHHAHAHVEGAEHLVVRDPAPRLDQAEEGRDLPGAPADPGPEALGKHARDVAREAAPGDVGERPHLVALEERLEGGQVAHGAAPGGLVPPWSRAPAGGCPRGSPGGRTAPCAPASSRSCAGPPRAGPGARRPRPPPGAGPSSGPPPPR